MIIYHKNLDGYIKAYFEWDVVNEKGKQDYQGEYMYVRDIWVHPEVDGEVAIAKFIGELEHHKKNVTVKHIYWKRHKTGKMRVSRSFSRQLCVRKFIKLFRRAQCYT